jgi:hypothetical protein
MFKKMASNMTFSISLLLDEVLKGFRVLSGVQELLQ